MFVLPPETESLVSLAVDGDDQSMSRLLEAIRPGLLALIARKLDRRIAARVGPEDVVQTVLVTIWRCLVRFHEKSAVPFEIWLIRIAEQHVLDTHRLHLRSKKRSVRREINYKNDDAASYVLDSCCGPTGKTRFQPPSECMELKETLAYVTEKLRDLSQSDQELVRFIIFDEIPAAEIAKKLQLPSFTIRKRFSRVLVRLRSRFRIK